MIILSVHITT